MVAEHNTELSSAYEQLRQSVVQIEGIAAIQERNRIACDIHDSLGNALTALNIHLQTAIGLWHLDPTQAQEFLADTQRLATSAIKEVCQSVSKLRDDVLLENSLEALLNSLIQEFYQTTGICASTKISLCVPLPAEVVKTIYRIVQEALTNIRKYAQPTRVEIQLRATQTNLGLIIQDNGKGFKSSEKRTGFGITGMQERVAALKGNFNIESEPGSGCRIIVELPLVQITLLEHETHTEQKSAIIPEKTEIECRNYSILSFKQYEQLSHILVELIGPVAPILLQKVVERSHSFQELVDSFLCHLPKDKCCDFQTKVKFLFENDPEAESISFPMNEDFLIECEQDLADLIGPIASLLIRKTLTHFPQISRLEFVKVLALEIRDTRKAYQFQRKYSTLSY
ncbi:MAG: sensor histidine kinase [Rhizonema sp. NSF051]|nr:sensor histidine kinase [Rhizonema sp. NSF051]